MIAHELSHIGNRDILLETIVVVLVGAISLISNLFIRGRMFGMGGRRSSNDSEGGQAGAILMLVGLVFIVLSPIISMLIQLAGSGNMKLIKNPVIKFPDGFELYDPKVTNNFKTSPAGVSGTKTIEYLFIPRHSGNFEIPSAEISYFDTQEKTYKTMKTPAYKLQVAKG